MRNMTMAYNTTAIGKSMEEHITFLHQACGNPVKSTCLKAINNNHFKSWTNLTIKNLNKYLGKTFHILRGHMQNIRKNKGKLRKKEPISTKELQNPFVGRNQGT